MVWTTRATVSVLVAVAALTAVLPVVALGGPTARANATLFGPNVFVFDPSMPAADIQKTVNALFAKMEANEFGSERHALLFKPGKYNVTFNVGFYTHVAGLGQNPDDVHINGGVNVTADWKANANATCNFRKVWKSPARKVSDGFWSWTRVNSPIHNTRNPSFTVARILFSCSASEAGGRSVPSPSSIRTWN
jgi:hypothetical protein